MDKVIKFSVQDLDFSESERDIRFATARIKAFASGKNAHELPVSEEVLKDSVDSIYKMPVLWKPDFFSNDATGHGEPEDQIPFGFVDPEDANLELSTDTDGRIWMTVNAKIWKRYAEKILTIFKRDGEKAVSVEMKAQISEDDFGNEFISKVLFYGITVLGKFKKPAVEDANMEILMFSEDVERYNSEKNFSTDEDELKYKFNLNQAFYVAGRLNIDFNNSKFKVEDFLIGMNIELEHGSINSNTNVTNDDPVETGKIALTHLTENPNYYDKNVGLKAWEEELEEIDNTDNKEVEIVAIDKKDEVVENEEVVKNEEVVENEDTEETVECEEVVENEDTTATEDDKEEEEEKEEDAEEKEEEVDNSDDANIEADAQIKMNANETEEFKTMSLEFEALQSKYDLLFSENETLKSEKVVLMEQMSDYDELKKFQLDTENTQKEVRMETILNEIDSKLSKFKKGMTQEDRDKAKLEFVNFDSIDAWANHVKALAFSAIDDTVDESFIKIGLPIANPITSSKDSVWNRI